MRAADGMTSRPYRSERDYQHMLSLLSEIYRRTDGPVCCTTGELEWWRFQESDPDGEIASAHLWESADDEVIGYAWPTGDVVDTAFLPERPELIESILDWSEADRRRRAGDESGVVLRAAVVMTDAVSVAVHRARGFERREPRCTWRRRSLDGPLPDHRAAPGYVVRSVSGERELRARVERTVHPFTEHLVDAPTYREELNLAAVAPDRSLAAVCTAWIDERNRLGIFEPVECLPAHRRRGLARAMMSEGLRRLRRLGATHAMMVNGPSNEAAAALYASLGFDAVGEIATWERLLD